MFSPIGAYPIGVFRQDPGVSGDASGALDFTGAAAGSVIVAGAGSTAFALNLVSTGTNGRVRRGSLLGFGPIGAGTIGEVLSIPTTITTVTGAATATFGLTGAASGVLPIIGRAPDIVLTQWSTTVGSGSVTIGAYPAPPVTPAWNISVGAPGYTVVEYPNYASLVSNVPFINFTLSATGTSERTGSVSGAIGFTLGSVGIVRVAGAATGAISLDLASVANARVGGALSGAFGLTGVSTGRIGNIPVTGIADLNLDFTASATIDIGDTATANLTFDIAVIAAGTVAISGSLAGVLDLTCTAESKVPSGRRIAYPKQSANNALLITAERAAKLLGA